MAQGIELAIQQHLLQYLNGEIQLHEFEDWFVPILWSIDTESESAREMAGEIHILISEFSRGDRTLAALREGLAASVHPLAEHPLAR
jgi:hypothetical protein